MASLKEFWRDVSTEQTWLRNPRTNDTSAQVKWAEHSNDPLQTARTILNNAKVAAESAQARAQSQLASMLPKRPELAAAEEFNTANNPHSFLHVLRRESEQKVANEKAKLVVKGADSHKPDKPKGP